ncbi:MAG: hypothetical protein IPQ24_12775 [Anaeromyxobacter sp.]|nr:hypothetical protein [Anaeromyxobacter sp.]
MTHLLVATAVLAASLAADPAPAAAAAKKAVAKPAAAVAEKAAAKGAEAEKKAAAKLKPEAPPMPEKKPASPAALKDAVASLLGPCSPEMAGGKVTAVEVLDGAQLNARLEKEKSKKAKAEPAQRFIAISYEAGGTTGKSVRQVSTQYMLTTEQAQALLGEKLCVFQE